MKQKIGQLIDLFFEKPIYVFIYFIFINTVPSILLVFTEPFDLWGKFTLILFPIGIYFMLYTSSRRIGLVGLILFPLLFFHAFQIVVFGLFGEGVIAADMFLNLMTTSVSEAGELMGSIFIYILFVLVLYLSSIYVGIVAMKRNVFLARKFRYKAFAVGMVLVFISYGISFKANNYYTDRFNYHEDVYPANLFYNLAFATDLWEMSLNYYKTSANFTFEAQKEDSISARQIYVMLIGETGRAESWSLYGYERETNPILSQDSNIIVFRDAITQSNTTHKSVPVMLSAASAENYNLIYKQKSILEAFNEVDFNTVFISNQASNRTFTDYFAKEAKNYEYHRFFGESANHPDEIVVERMKHYIDSIPGNIFFVLHTYGSHFNYTERYPKEFAKYQPDHIQGIGREYISEMRNAYDNTVLYTDYVISQIIKTLEETDACSAMIYAADHGEDLLDDDRNRFLHSSPNPTYYQLKIPFILWFSPQYKNTFSDKVDNAITHQDFPVSTNMVFHTMLDLAHIKTINSNTHLSLTNEAFKKQDRMYLDEHYNPVPYWKAELKKEDQMMIDKRNMAR